MGMNIPAGGGDDGEGELNSTINTTPLVDIMLVILIIFLITVPVVIKTVPVELPKASNVPTQTKPENIVIAVSADGKVYWNDGVLPDNATLLAKLKEVAVLPEQPEIHIRGDKESRYEYVGRVIYYAQRAGIRKVGFITEAVRGG
jgi:biopolymer transport protein ExbD